MILDDEITTAVLTPIDGGVGTDGRVTEDDALAGRFRELRSQRKAIFREEQKAAMGEDVPDTGTWTWDVLGDYARDYLIEDAKDLEPMAMLIEASVRIDGLPGLSRAMNTMADLVATFWEQGLYPLDDEEDGVEARFQPLSGLSGGSNDKEGTLIMPLRRLLLAGGPGGELRFIDRVAAETQFGNAQKSDQKVRDGLVAEAEAAFAAIETAALRLSPAALKAAIADLDAAEAGWRRGVDFIVKRTSPKMPAASRVTEELGRMREWLKALLKKLPEEVEPLPDVIEDGPAGTPAVATTAAADGPISIGRISRRDDALRAVQAAADYFERLEPQSPIGGALREVDRRARMSLDALLEELIPDGAVRQNYYWRSGIKPPAEAG